MYLLVDVDSAFCEFERKRRPELIGKPVVVTAGEAAVVAISREAKALGVRRGEPLFKLRERLPADSQICFLPADHRWYHEASSELMGYLRSQAPAFWQYSVDEAFVDMTGVRVDLKQWGERLYENVRDKIHVSVSIGIAPTKTLAKIAAHFAKHYEGYHHCCVIDTEEKRRKALQGTVIKDVWGIGRQYVGRMQRLGIGTAYDLAQRSVSWLRLQGASKAILDTRNELCGIDCIPMRDPGPKKSISSTRTFSKMTSSLDDLSVYVSEFAADCAEDLRRQHSVACAISVFIATNPYREDLPQYAQSLRLKLETPTNLTNELSVHALHLLKKIFREGYRYKRAGVVVDHLISDEGVQASLFDFDARKHEKNRKVNEVVDRINRKLGEVSIKLGNQIDKKDRK